MYLLFDPLTCTLREISHFQFHLIRITTWTLTPILLWLHWPRTVFRLQDICLQDMSSRYVFKICLQDMSSRFSSYSEASALKFQSMCFYHFKISKFRVLYLYSYIFINNLMIVDLQQFLLFLLCNCADRIFKYLYQWNCRIFVDYVSVQ